MKKSSLKIGLFIGALSASVCSWALNPCMPIAMACKGQGTYQNKQELIKNCVLPVANGAKVLPNTAFTANQRQQCKAEIMQKIEEKATQ